MDKTKLSCVIIDDEPAAIRILKGYCKKAFVVEVIGSFRNPIEAVTYLNKNKVDFILLDIKMPQLSGVELLHSLSNPPNVILTTAYSEFALESYDYDVVDYLLKPIRFNRFLKAINKINTKLDLIKKATLLQSSKISLKDGKTIHTIENNEIIYIESLGNYVKVFTKTKSIIVKSGLQEFIKKYKDVPLVRVHKSYAIYKDKVTKLTYHNIHLSSIEIPIGRTYKSELKKIILDKNTN